MRGADTVPGSSRGYDAGKKINGRKRHIAVDTGGLLLAVVVTMAGIQDRDGAYRLLAALRTRFTTVSLMWTDGGYAGRLLIWAKKVLLLPSTSSNALMISPASPCCPAAGSSSAPSAGSAGTAAASATTRPCQNTTKPSSTFHDHDHVRRLARTGNW